MQTVFPGPQASRGTPFIKKSLFNQDLEGGSGVREGGTLPLLSEVTPDFSEELLGHGAGGGNVGEAAVGALKQAGGTLLGATPG